jgi:hypothetical protein
MGRRNRVTGTVSYGNDVEIRDTKDWRYNSHPWTIELRYQKRRMTVPFWNRQDKEPTIADALHCVASDAMGYEGSRSFEDWAGDYGYDTDSRAAEATYEQVKAQTRALRRLLGQDYGEIAEAAAGENADEYIREPA